MPQEVEVLVGIGAVHCRVMEKTLNLMSAQLLFRNSRKPSQTVRPGHERPRSRSTVIPHSRMIQRPTISPEMYFLISSSLPKMLRKLLMLRYGSRELTILGCVIMKLNDFSFILAFGRGRFMTDCLLSGRLVGLAPALFEPGGGVSTGRDAEAPRVWEMGPEEARAC